MTERELGEIIAKLSMIHDDINAIMNRQDKLEARLRELERARGILQGMAIVMSGVAGYVIAKLKGVL